MNSKIKPKQCVQKEINLAMPEVKDIPGQEHIRPPRFRGMMDITVASPGEEGEGVLDDLNKEDEDTGSAAR